MGERFAESYRNVLVAITGRASSAQGYPMLNPRAIEFMKEVGYDLTRHQSKGLADLSGGEFDVVVGMGCGDEGCPLVKADRHEEWGVPDPKEMPAEGYRRARDLIETKVKELLARL